MTLRLIDTEYIRRVQRLTGQDQASISAALRDAGWEKRPADCVEWLVATAVPGLCAAVDKHRERHTPEQAPERLTQNLVAGLIGLSARKDVTLEEIQEVAAQLAPNFVETAAHFLEQAGWMPPPEVHEREDSR